MATLSSGDTLSLNNLATATDQSTKSMGTVAGSTATPISMSAFAIDSVGAVTGFTYVVENTSEDYVLGFGGDGGRFVKIREKKRNFDWSITGGGTIYFTSASYSEGGAGSGSLTIAAGEMKNAGTQTALVGATSHTLGVKFADGFNDHATNYNSSRTKTIYSVDSYDGNAASLCLVSDAPIEKADGTVVEVGDLSEGDVLKGYALDGLPEDSDANNDAGSADESDDEYAPRFGGGFGGGEAEVNEEDFYTCEQCGERVPLNSVRPHVCITLSDNLSNEVKLMKVRGQRHGASHPRVKPLRDALDHTALAGAVASLAQDQHLGVGRHNPVLELDHLSLKAQQVRIVDAPVQTLGMLLLV